jgi:mannose-6-phosphate isomerase
MNAQLDLPLYPLLFEPIYKQKVWGGRTLERLGRMLPDDDQCRIGESWELADLSQSSPSGGGGGMERSIIANGPLAGRSLHEVIVAYGPVMLGRLPLTEHGEFPLLVKFLDARENLSVQVHPSAAYAADHAEALLKSEAWYVVDAEPGAAIYKGVRTGTTAAEFRHAIESNDLERVESFLIKVPVKAGDCHYLPSGTCHALGAGVLVAEVQTPSDTTFRVFDWGRTGRELHIEQAMQCMDFGPPNVRHHEKRSHIAGVFTTVSRLVTCEYFRIEKVRMAEGYQHEIPYDQPAVWIVLESSGVIEPNNGGPATPFTTGQTLLVPAGLDQGVVKLGTNTIWLEVTFPKALVEQIA